MTVNIGDRMSRFKHRCRAANTYQRYEQSSLTCILTTCLALVSIVTDQRLLSIIIRYSLEALGDAASYRTNVSWLFFGPVVQQFLLRSIKVRQCQE